MEKKSFGQALEQRIIEFYGLKGRSVVDAFDTEVRKAALGRGLQVGTIPEEDWNQIIRETAARIFRQDFFVPSDKP